MADRKRKGECEGCQVKRTLIFYEGRQFPTRKEPDMWLCISCANTVGIAQTMLDYNGKLLLAINSKLDLLLHRLGRKESKRD